MTTRAPRVVVGVDGTEGSIEALRWAAHEAARRRWPLHVITCAELPAAVEAGFNRAWNSILDSNVSSLITAFILFYFGSSTIKGFALVLIIGVLCSLFTAVTVTRLILRSVIARKRFSSPYLYGVAKGDLDALDRGAING